MMRYEGGRWRFSASTFLLVVIIPLNVRDILMIHLKGKLFTHIDGPDNPPESTLHFIVSSVWHVYRWFIFVGRHISRPPVSCLCCWTGSVMSHLSIRPPAALHTCSQPSHQPPDHLLQHLPPRLHLIGSSVLSSSFSTSSHSFTLLSFLHFLPVDQHFLAHCVLSACCFSHLQVSLMLLTCCRMWTCLTC